MGKHGAELSLCPLVGMLVPWTHCLGAGIFWP
jgi:hypothetical protein